MLATFIYSYEPVGCRIQQSTESLSNKAILGQRTTPSVIVIDKCCLLPPKNYIQVNTANFNLCKMFIFSPNTIISTSNCF